MIIPVENHLTHYGTPRHSGRYPWGSGKPDTTRNRHLLDAVAMLKKDGLSEAEIARGWGISTKELRAHQSIASSELRMDKIRTAERLHEKGMSTSAIGRQMGTNESSVRALLAPGAKDRATATQATASMLEKHLKDKGGYLDVGKGVEYQVGVTKTRLDTAVEVLRAKGYETHNIEVPTIGTRNVTTTRVLAPPGTTKNMIDRNRADIKQITDHTEDNGHTYIATQVPLNLSSRRVAVRYGDEGGAKADGVIYVRPGVKDLAIGSKNYGQVRIAVDGTHYIKGMAVYKDDLPKGVDIEFNTNKSNTGRKKDAFKEMEKDANGNVDPANPFGAIVRQVNDPKTGKVTSVMNLVGSPTKEGSGEEGQWDNWSKVLPSQMLSKQPTTLAKQQLDFTYERRQRAYDEINALTNPSVKKKLLESFADQTDSAAVDLKAANLPRQATKVLMPVPSMKETEVYAPTMNHGESVALVRFPHGGRSEIPIVKVNNRNPEARRLLGTHPEDAIGINHKVAERLSGADFDGDTVLVIPNNRGLVKNDPPLEGLKNFDPRQYAIPKDSPIPRIKASAKQQQMGIVSNLITDMSLQGANNEEMSRALRHSMVVIDSEKHGLDTKASYKANAIGDLKKKYQGVEKGRLKGASTLISRAGAETHIPQRRLRKASEGGPVDPITGKKVFVDTGRTREKGKTVTDPVTGKKTWVGTGQMVKVTEVHKKLAVTEDAHKLSSGTDMERLYAEHSNKMKALANKARKQTLGLTPVPYSPSAFKTYSHEVETINAKLNIALKNAPLERQAQVLARIEVGQKRQAWPNMEKEDVKKIEQMALNNARNRTGAKKNKIVLTQSEWNAIQAGAISPTKLDKVLTNSDIDSIRKLALPKAQPKLTSSALVRAKSMLATGYTQSEVAEQLGISVSTLKVGLND